VKDTATHQGTKAPFEPPRLLAIELAADEVLGPACKLDTMQASMTSVCAAGGCSGTGS
jgi:hypothetical protein